MGQRASILRPIAPPHIHTGFPAVTFAAEAVVATSPAIVTAVGAMINTVAANANAKGVLEN